MNKDIKAVVVGGWLDKGVSQMISLIGSFEDITEAYGAAYLYLEEHAIDVYANEPGMYITLPKNLEGDSGHALYLCNKDGIELQYAYALYSDESED